MVRRHNIDDLLPLWSPTSTAMTRREIFSQSVCFNFNRLIVLKLSKAIVVIVVASAIVIVEIPGALSSTQPTCRVET